MQKYNYDVLGIGNAVTDIFVEVEESFLKKNNLVEGTMKLVDEVFIMELLKDLNISKTYAGGSVANTLSTISKLGGKCAFIGSRKNDKYGNLFSNSMEKEKIDLLNKGIVENPSITNIDKFIESAKTFFVDIDKAKHIGSMFTFRTVLPNRDKDDARPTLVENVTDKIFNVFSGKIGKLSKIGDCFTFP